MKLTSRILFGLSIAALLMVSVACKQANDTKKTASTASKDAADQQLVDQTAAMYTANDSEALKGLWTTINNLNSVYITNADTAVTLSKYKVKLTLPKDKEWDTGDDAGIKITWISSNTKAITLDWYYPNKNDVKMDVIHGEKDVDVTLSLKLTKGAAFKTVKVATFKVEKN
ncbi:MAG: hypothetical protein ACTTH8_03810 [Treponema sp.]